MLSKVTEHQLLTMQQHTRRVLLRICDVHKDLQASRLDDYSKAGLSGVHGTAHLSRSFTLSSSFSGLLIANLEVQGCVGLVHELVQLLHAADNLHTYSTT